MDLEREIDLLKDRVSVLENIKKFQDAKIPYIPYFPQPVYPVYPSYPWHSPWYGDSRTTTTSAGPVYL